MVAGRRGCKQLGDQPGKQPGGLARGVDFLKSADVTSIGFYAPTSDWQTITGGSTQFAAYPFWVPGAASLTDAQSRCVGSGVNGGPVSLVQFPQAPGSGDTTCVQQPMLAFAGAPQTLAVGKPSGPLIVQLSQAASIPVTVAFSSTSTGGRFATTAAGPWTASLTLVVPAGAAQTPTFYYTDAAAGTAVLTGSAPGYTAATQTETITAAACAAPPQHDHGVEIAVADIHTPAAAMTLRRQVVTRLRGLKLRLLIERDTCTDYEVAITGFPARSAATTVLHRLRPHFHQAALERH